MGVTRKRAEGYRIPIKTCVLWWRSKGVAPGAPDSAAPRIPKCSWSTVKTVPYNNYCCAAAALQDARRSDRNERTRYFSTTYFFSFHRHRGLPVSASPSHLLRRRRTSRASPAVRASGRRPSSCPFGRDRPAAAAAATTAVRATRFTEDHLSLAAPLHPSDRRPADRRRRPARRQPATHFEFPSHQNYARPYGIKKKKKKNRVVIIIIISRIVRFRRVLRRTVLLSLARRQRSSVIVLFLSLTFSEAAVVAVRPDNLSSAPVSFSTRPPFRPVVFAATARASFVKLSDRRHYRDAQLPQDGIVVRADAQGSGQQAENWLDRRHELLEIWVNLARANVLRVVRQATRVPTKSEVAFDGKIVGSRRARRSGRTCLQSRAEEKI